VSKFPTAEQSTTARVRNHHRGNSPTNQQQSYRREFEKIHLQIQALDGNQAREEDLFKFEDEFYDTISSADEIVNSIKRTSGRQQSTDGLSGTGQSPTNVCENAVSVKLSESNFPIQQAVEKLKCKTETITLPVIEINEAVSTINSSAKSFEKPKNLKLADPQFYISRLIDLLIEIVYYIIRSKNEVLCAAAGRLAAERSEAKAHKTNFAPNNIYYFFFKPS
jgi:hypothetical protein